MGDDIVDSLSLFVAAVLQGAAVRRRIHAERCESNHVDRHNPSGSGDIGVREVAALEEEPRAVRLGAGVGQAIGDV